MSVRLREVTDRLSARIQSRQADGIEDSEAGMVTSEYVMGTAVAAGCVGVFYKIITSGPFLDMVKRYVLSHFLHSFG